MVPRLPGLLCGEHPFCTGRFNILCWLRPGATGRPGPGLGDSSKVHTIFMLKRRWANSVKIVANSIHIGGVGSIKGDWKCNMMFTWSGLLITDEGVN